MLRTPFTTVSFLDAKPQCACALGLKTTCVSPLCSQPCQWGEMLTLKKTQQKCDLL